MPTVVIEIDPRELHVPPSRLQGADSAKLQRQIARYGRSDAGMPEIWAFRGSDDALVIYNGVTRATRMAKLSPGKLVRVRVIGKWKRPAGHLPKIGDVLP